MMPKFRVWDIRRKKFRDDVYVDCKGNLYEFSKDTGYGKAISYLNEEYIKIMQSTGLKDINGVEIFEGDILNITRNIPFLNIVKIDKKNATFQLYPLDKRWSKSYFTNYENSSKERFEIIGNIYEDRELVEMYREE